MSEIKRFALIGAAGYIAPKHMAAISALGHELVAGLDPHDSVGILDRYAPKAAFFTEFERFDRFLSKLSREGKAIDYLVVCSPNYLHDAHCRFGLRLGAEVICEKPIALNTRNIDGLISAEQEYGHRIWCILQARLHQEVARLKTDLASTSSNSPANVTIDYVTPRGSWYDYSWKGESSRSGGVETNIGIHLLDLVCYLFGEAEKIRCLNADLRSYSGELTLANAEVSFRVSVKQEDLPENQTTAKRLFEVNGKQYDLSAAFDDLHLESYKKILEGKGFGISDARPAIKLAENLRAARP